MHRETGPHWPCTDAELDLFLCVTGTQVSAPRHPEDLQHKALLVKAYHLRDAITVAGSNGTYAMVHDL